MSLEWCAGFFDGEGSVGFWKQRGTRGIGGRLTASVSQKVRQPLETFLAHAPGGNINGPYNRSDGRIIFNLTYTGESAIALYSKIRPYLVLKGSSFDSAITEYRAAQAAYSYRRTPTRRVPTK